MIAAVVLAAGIGAALQINLLFSTSRQLADANRSLLLQLARVDALASDLAAAQAAYVAPGQPDAPWLERVDRLTSDLTTTLATVRAAARSAAAPTQLQAMTEAMAKTASADASARADLQQDQDLMAADVVFSEARDAINAIRRSAADLAGAEAGVFETDRAANEQQALIVAAAAGGLILIGLLLLAPLPRTRQEPVVDLSLRDASVPSGDLSRVAPAEEPVAPVVDLAGVADLCTALSRVESSAALPDMLARTAALLDASGVIVWLAAGNELHAATSHGYNPRVISRLGAINRDADNATADAWRSGELRTVEGDVMSNGAIVAPMFGPDACVGVLAAEVRHGRERDAATRAVTLMIAAQLATVLAAWPAAPQSHAAEA